MSDWADIAITRWYEDEPAHLKEDTLEALAGLLRQNRLDVLEEAATLAESGAGGGHSTLATAIRALASEPLLPAGEEK